MIRGGWQLSPGHGTGRPDRRQLVARLADEALSGSTTFDCADIYEGVEELFGAVRREVRRRSGGASDVQIHTKFVPDLGELDALDRRAVVEHVDRSLRRLGIERLDLLQFHWWDFERPGWLEAAGWLDALRRQGKIRALGVTNFDTQRLRQLLDAGIPVASNQVQYSLVDRRPERSLAELCRQRNVALLAYGGLLGGFLTERWLGAPSPRPPYANRSLQKYALIVDEAGGWAVLQELLRRLGDLGDDLGSSASAVALRWLLDRPAVSAVIVGISPDRPSPLPELLRLGGASSRIQETLEPVVASLAVPPGDVYELERRRDGRHGRIMRYDLNRDRGGQKRPLVAFREPPRRK